MKNNNLSVCNFLVDSIDKRTIPYSKRDLEKVDRRGIHNKPSSAERYVLVSRFEDSHANFGITDTNGKQTMVGIDYENEKVDEYSVTHIMNNTRYTTTDKSIKGNHTIEAINHSSGYMASVYDNITEKSDDKNAIIQKDTQLISYTPSEPYIALFYDSVLDCNLNNFVRKHYGKSSFPYKRVDIRTRSCKNDNLEQTYEVTKYYNKKEDCLKEGKPNIISVVRSNLNLHGKILNTETSITLGLNPETGEYEEIDYNKKLSREEIQQIISDEVENARELAPECKQYLERNGKLELPKEYEKSIQKKIKQYIHKQNASKLKASMNKSKKLDLEINKLQKEKRHINII